MAIGDDVGARGGNRHPGGDRAAGVVASDTADVLPDAWLGVEVSGLCDAGLQARLAQVGRARSQLAAVEAAALREIIRRDGEAAAAHTAVNVLSVSGRAARSDVKTAVALGGLATTRDALVSGAVPAGHARLIADAAGEVPVNEQFLVERARVQGHDEFRRTVARHVAVRSGDDGASLLERQRSQRCARVFTNRETGMTVVNGQFDPIVGARIAAAVDAATGRLFRNEDPHARRTPAQRTADAVAKLICEPDTARPAGTSLVLIADYDTLNQHIANARLANGTPVPISEIAKIAVNAGILPAIFSTATGELRMGRRRRAATELQRSALAVRDHGCVGCGAAPELCRAHHIVEWQHGGNTDLDNLVSVCHYCHHNKIHHDGFTVERSPDTGRYRLQPPDKTRPAATALPTNRASPTSPDTQQPAADPQPAQRLSTKQPRTDPQPAQPSEPPAADASRRRRRPAPTPTTDREPTASLPPATSKAAQPQRNSAPTGGASPAARPPRQPPEQPECPAADASAAADTANRAPPE
ncbi:HNH endonuclease [Candidatus Poriferisodalis sp.]|uniref:HNH endonuclease n=1 Tax=Candidatus Poriferisodalis sp. TaxID=3101277 RepID=UPI003B01152C